MEEFPRMVYHPALGLSRHLYSGRIFMDSLSCGKIQEAWGGTHLDVSMSQPGMPNVHQCSSITH